MVPKIEIAINILKDIAILNFAARVNDFFLFYKHVSTKKYIYVNFHRLEASYSDGTSNDLKMILNHLNLNGRAKTSHDSEF